LEPQRGFPPTLIAFVMIRPYFTSLNPVPMSMDTLTIVKPISPEDRAILKKLKNKAWFSLAKTYSLFFLALGYVYFRMSPGSTYKGHTLGYGKMTGTDYDHVYYIIAAFFGSIFLYFLIRDFRRMVLPLEKEMRLGNKYCDTFFARKYKDPIYNKCLLFYPGKEDLYIEISQEDFDSVGNGEQLQLESACITGEVLCLKSGEKVFSTATEFSFSEVAIVNSLKSE